MATRKKSTGEGVVISNNLQLAFVFFLIAAQGVGGFVQFWNLLSYSSVPTESWVAAVLQWVFPIALVGVAYVYTKKHKTPLNRLFVATVKGIAAYALYGIVSSLNYQLLAVAAEGPYIGLPEWAGTLTNQVILMSVVLAVYLGVLHFWMYDKKGRAWR